MRKAGHSFYVIYNKFKNTAQIIRWIWKNDSERFIPLFYSPKYKHSVCY